MSIATPELYVDRDVFIDDMWVVRRIVIQGQHARFETLFQGTEKQCRDWARTTKHQKKLAENKR